ncbi:MAG TPA: bifunctional histidinol-phosphatase/imidazoleglycerol-phosphate dehydratase HisB [Flavipsychrobacter sp.]|nr:bifunctional histidinol-phosphatase/imidazoleglycerol-phosphate dehydratase HisB [Flavipsychrobacter sp.]
MKKKVLFIDRDGTIIKEPPVTFQVDTLGQLSFIPGVIRNLYLISQLGYELVMVTNQDGLGTNNYPEENFNIVQSKLLDILSAEGITFSAIHIDRSFVHENKDTRKPGIGMLRGYLTGLYDLGNSYVIGDRPTDVQLAKNLGAKTIFIQNYDDASSLKDEISLFTNNWDDIYRFLCSSYRKVNYTRKTSETDISVELNPDGTGAYSISTGLEFFNHMLEQLARHGNMDLKIKAIGDLHIDEHHTIEDTGIAIGEALLKALGDKKGIERYGYCLPMDDCLAQVAIDFGGRSWLQWDVVFNREKIGDVPTEMFYHFFKSFCDGARCNLNIKAEGINEHHKIEAIFKAFARSVKMAVKTDKNNMVLPTTKGVI